VGLESGSECASHFEERNLAKPHQRADLQGDIMTFISTQFWNITLHQTISFLPFHAN
jgi:hypothetical protein